MIKNSLGEEIKPRTTYYWYVIDEDIILRQANMDNDILRNYAEPYIFPDSDSNVPRGRTALSKSIVGAALLLEELKNLMKKEYGEQTINF
jgi:hypothetical protein